MPILRHEHKTDYTVIPNNLIRDNRLSVRDVGLLCVMLSLPDDWSFSVNGLVSMFQHDGRDGISASLKRIEEAGYLRREQTREKGKLGAVVWIVSDTPSPCTDLPCTVLPDTVFPYTENPIQQNKDITKYPSNKVPSNNISARARDKFKPPTLEEVTAYCQQRGSKVDPQTFFDYFEAGGWKDSHGKQVKSWKQKIITWERMGVGHAGKDTASEPTRRKYDGFKYD